MNISEMGGGTPIGMLRKDVADKQTQQMTQYMNDRQQDDDAIDALINKINTDTDECVPKKRTNSGRTNSGRTNNRSTNSRSTNNRSPNTNNKRTNNKSTNNK